MKTFLKKLIPKPLLKLYHYLLAELAVLYYHYPSRHLIVIGVTGTKGKSTTSYLTAKMLEHAGFKVGLSSTIMFKIAHKEWLNDKKMTMLGRFGLQKLLSQMVKAKCHYAVIETSSEGIAQYRHLGIDYDVLIFTGLAPEHIESHGCFEKYKATKLRVFQDLEHRKNKVIKFNKINPQIISNNSSNISNKISKVIIANGESEYAEEFLNFKVDEKINYQLSVINYQNEEYKVSEVNTNSEGIKFKINNTRFNLKLFSQFNLLNVLATVSVGLSQGISLEKISQALKSIKTVPGRLEVVYDKQFKVIVDYAHEPHSMENLYQEVRSWVRLGFETQQPWVDLGFQAQQQKKPRIITVFGATGGGRDKWRRPKMGELSAKYCDIIILTTDDPYQDDPEEIISQIEAGIKKNAECRMQNVRIIKIVDRKQAIKKAIDLAEPGDIVLILGKGSEQKIALKDGYRDWDDRKIVKKILNSVKKGGGNYSHHSSVMGSHMEELL